MATMQKITSNLWFDSNAEEAVKFYTTVFKNTEIGKISRYGKEGFEYHGKPEGTPMVIQFKIEGQWFSALNGGPQFKFNEAISFIVNCETQEEIDYYWEKLSEGGDEKAQVCGWLKDKFGVSWQIVPTILQDLITGSQETANRVMNELLKMKKLNIAKLQEAAK